MYEFCNFKTSKRRNKKYEVNFFRSFGCFSVKYFNIEKHSPNPFDKKRRLNPVFFARMKNIYRCIFSDLDKHLENDR